MKWIFILSIALLSFSAQAQITASPNFIDFGDVSIEGGVGRSISVWVRSSVNQTINLTVRNSCFSPYTTYHNCHSLFPYGSCSIQIRFQPMQEGRSSCNISLSGIGGHGFASIQIQGRGVKNRSLELNEPYAE